MVRQLLLSWQWFDSTHHLNQWTPSEQLQHPSDPPPLTPINGVGLGVRGVFPTRVCGEPSHPIVTSRQ